jgi:hypothetical protein
MLFARLVGSALMLLSVPNSTSPDRAPDPDAGQARQWVSAAPFCGNACDIGVLHKAH